jgi:hypothetical protein
MVEHRFVVPRVEGSSPFFHPRMLVCIDQSEYSFSMGAH